MKRKRVADELDLHTILKCSMPLMNQKMTASRFSPECDYKPFLKEPADAVSEVKDANGWLLHRHFWCTSRQHEAETWVRDRLRVSVLHMAAEIATPILRKVASQQYIIVLDAGSEEGKQLQVKVLEAVNQVEITHATDSAAARLSTKEIVARGVWYTWLTTRLSALFLFLSSTSSASTSSSFWFEMQMTSADFWKKTAVASVEMDKSRAHSLAQGQKDLEHCCNVLQAWLDVARITICIHRADAFHGLAPHGLNKCTDYLSSLLFDVQHGYVPLCVIMDGIQVKKSWQALLDAHPPKLMSSWTTPLPSSIRSKE